MIDKIVIIVVCLSLLNTCYQLILSMKRMTSYQNICKMVFSNDDDKTVRENITKEIERYYKIKK